MANKKLNSNKPEIKVTVKNRPTKEQASIKLKQLGEFLSSGESPPDSLDASCNK